MRIEDFFDLRIATLGPEESPPPDAHLARIEDPGPALVEARTRRGWFYKPCYVTYVLAVPRSLEAYIESAFPSPARSKPRKLLREVPRRYRLRIEEDLRSLPAFADLYRRTIVSRPRGKDRLAEHDEGFGPGWLGYFLFDGDAMVAGVLAHEQRRQISVGYGAFDPAHRALDLEHYLLLQVLQRGIDLGGDWLSLGMDTNRYGHHLSLGLPAYKMRLGFAPAAFEPGGRELVSIRSFEPFEEGLFFYSYEEGALVGRLFTRGEPDARPFAHPTAPPLRHHPISP